jgi:hypothetical protein
VLAPPRSGQRRYVCKTGHDFVGCGKTYIDGPLRRGADLRVRALPARHPRAGEAALSGKRPTTSRSPDARRAGRPEQPTSTSSPTSTAPRDHRDRVGTRPQAHRGPPQDRQAAALPAQRTNQSRRPRRYGQRATEPVVRAQPQPATRHRRRRARPRRRRPYSAPGAATGSTPTASIRSGGCRAGAGAAHLRCGAPVPPSRRRSGRAWQGPSPPPAPAAQHRSAPSTRRICSLSPAMMPTPPEALPVLARPERHTRSRAGHPSPRTPRPAQHRQEWPSTSTGTGWNPWATS